MREFYKKYKGLPFVQDRKRHNVDSPSTEVGKSVFWKKMVGCLLTSRQRSSPDSSVNRFIGQDPFPLDYARCRKSGDVKAYCKAAITRFGGIRFGNRIAEFVGSNLQYLDDEGGWDVVLTEIKTLSGSSEHNRERQVARLIADVLKGFGPKQSRNLLQELGVTQYETPLDSRIAKWLNDFGFPVRLNSNMLSDEQYYSFVLDGFQTLCGESGVLPCLMDAAVFTSFDSK